MYKKEELQEKWLNNVNAITKRFYLWLFNQLNLKSQGYPKPERLTFYQAKQNGLRVKPWEKSVSVIYQSVVPDYEFVDWELVEKEVMYKRIHQLFNIDQTEPVLNSNNE